MRFKNHHDGKSARRGVAALAALAALFAVGAAKAQSLTVLPVNIEMGAGQLATTLTVMNGGASESSVQVRAFAWGQANGVEQLTPSSDVIVSPPIATIPAGGSQVVRLVLRHAPQGHEATYRVLLDQIPPAAAAGTVRVALRLSIPVFAQPATRALPHVQYHVGTDAGQVYLIALNDGGRHETIRDLALTSSKGGALKTENASPYILAGATNRWRIVSPGQMPAAGETLRLTGKGNTGPLDVPVTVSANP